VSNPIPRATYRLQLSEQFGFAAVEKLAPYLDELGISHAYLSPILAARRHSTHGYDVVDHTRLNPELGDVAAFERMSAALQRRGLGILLDIVPNHMGVGGDQNELWLDVLENGAESRYADWFDIDWTPPEPTLQGKLLVPFLSCSLGEALERGKLELRLDPVTDALAVWAEGTHKLPLRRDSYHLVQGPEQIGWFNAPEGRGDLLKLIERQHWRPARYTVAADDINYRRFFINSDLAGIRVERDDVFAHSHRLILDLIAAGHVQGLRVDHIDGLYDPKDYCLRLRERSPKPIYLCVEKILAEGEEVPVDWQVDGTTGYEFGSQVIPLLADPDGEEELRETYREFTGRAAPFAETEVEAKREIMRFEMAGELTSLATALRSAAAAALQTSDLPLTSLRTALADIVAQMQVYRTYLDDRGIAAVGTNAVSDALAAARMATPALDPAAFDYVGRVMVGEVPDALPVARRIQQFSGPVMAKGLEDTALYRDNRLVGLNDVGAKPDRFSVTTEEFHQWAMRRAKSAPHGLLAGSTHDSKRGEDVRARLAALSMYADDWGDAAHAWRRRLDRAGAETVDPDDLYLFFQLLVGAWPADLVQQGELATAAVAAFEERLQGAMLKSCREARRRTNWMNPDAGYEEAVRSFISSAMADTGFLWDVSEFVAVIAPAGYANGLIAAALRLTLPGIPDIYQGAEFWEQSLVDPDNRRPPDFDTRRASLRDSGRDMPLDGAALADGRLKQRLLRDLLALRREMPELFANGSYEPMDLGDDRDVLAFVRRHDAQCVIVAVRLKSEEARWEGVRSVPLAEMPSEAGVLDALAAGPIFVAVCR